MTLVLALRCRDGVVLASDGQATSEAAGQPTRQPARKLFELGGRIAWGASGSVGLQQALEEELEARAGELLAAADPRRALVDAVIPIQQRAIDEFVPLPGTRPPDLSCIFCWHGPRSGPRIFSIPRTGGDHQLHDRHAADGSGDIFADFAMAWIRQLGPDELSLETAKMVVLRALLDAIDVAAVYLGPPIQMYTVTATGTREVPAKEITGPLASSVDAWQGVQREALTVPGTPASVHPFPRKGA
jgi:20S proteasome alpha/beta subunit